VSTPAAAARCSTEWGHLLRALHESEGWVMSSYAKFCLILTGLSAGLAACTTLHVTTDVNPNFSVANCHTYSFATERSGGADAAFSNPLNSDRLRAAVESNLAARGVTKAADKASADCVIGYAMGTRQVFNDYYAGWGPGWGVGYGWGRGGYGWGGGWGYDGPWVQNETRIVVDVFDARAHKPIWHGAVSQTISDLQGPNAVTKINAGTAAIFAKLPIGTAPPPPASRPS
jgi:Domain of unknown function (DUF4136)